MGILKDCINNKKINSTPIWFMRQAGRYLPEFREIRSKNKDFINLCLNPILSKEITLQPLKRFSVDAAIIFSDILLIPYALGQNIEFEKNFGPKLGNLDLDKVLTTSDESIINIGEDVLIDFNKDIVDSLKKKKYTGNFNSH